MSWGTLYVVATPIGHLGDLTERARVVLSDVPVVAAEDTRRTRKLLHHLGCRPKVMSYHAHSDAGRVRAIVGLLRDGTDVALVTDAGTPGISDPGSVLIRAVRDAGGPVVPVPGPSAVAAALSASGMAGDRYLFLGFLPRRGPERRRLLDHIRLSRWPVVLFEAPRRVVALLEALSGILDGERRVVVARELTKRHEEIRDDTLDGHRTYWSEKELRGEFTLIIEAGPGNETESGTTEETRRDARSKVYVLLAEGHSSKEATACLVKEYGLPRNEAYQMVMECRDGDSH